VRNAPSLLAQARNQANEEHNRRMAELKTLAPLLEKLDAYVPQLEAQGLRFYTHNMGLRSARMETDARRVYKVLRLHTEGYTLAQKAETTAKWFKALTALGLKPVKAEEGVFPTVTLRNGTLLVCVDAHADWLPEVQQALQPATTREAA
jgi:hypothetical protein